MLSQTERLLPSDSHSNVPIETPLLAAVPASLRTGFVYILSSSLMPQSLRVGSIRTLHPLIDVTHNVAAAHCRLCPNAVPLHLLWPHRRHLECELAALLWF